MRGFLRKLFLAILAVGALAALAYHARHKIHLGDFTWSRFAHAVGQANLWLLLLSVVAIYVCLPCARCAGRDSRVTSGARGF